MSKIFGENLKRLRLQHNLYQKDLAEEFNVNAVTILHWEKNESEPSMDKLCQIADFFNVTPNYLLGFETEHKRD